MFNRFSVTLNAAQDWLSEANPDLLAEVQDYVTVTAPDLEVAPRLTLSFWERGLLDNDEAQAMLAIADNYESAELAEKLAFCTIADLLSMTILTSP